MNIMYEVIYSYVMINYTFRQWPHILHGHCNNLVNKKKKNFMTAFKRVYNMLKMYGNLDRHTSYIKIPDPCPHYIHFS